MTLLDRISEATTDTATLDKFLSNNALQVVDWFNTLPHAELLSLREPIRQFVYLRRRIWEALPATANNQLFLTLLLEKVEQLGDTGSFHRIYSALSGTAFVIGSRLEAAALYMADKPADDKGYLARLEPIYVLLEEAIRTEDDNVDKALSTILHYYTVAIASFRYKPDVAVTIWRWLSEKRSSDPGSFLRCQLMDDVLAIPLRDPIAAVTEMVSLLDRYLNRTVPVLHSIGGLIVEDRTWYCEQLARVPSEFDSIRAISVREHRANPHGDADRLSLNRGTAIIDREGQLFAYMHSYGPMHSKKLISAYEHIPFATLSSPLTVVDWGCGQGTATMMLFDFLSKRRMTLDVNQVILIEPSQLALARAGRHAQKYDRSVKLETLDKTLNTLTPGHFTIAPGTTLHLFSNILDVDAVSLTSLSGLVKATFPGRNYFVCVSPYVNDAKTERLNIFRNSFFADNYEMLFEANNRAGAWLWDWTRVVRVFKADL